MSPDHRQHRGAHPADRELFAVDRLPALRTATAELSWLLSRGYSAKSARALVGDRHSLNERQRLAVARAACSDTSRARRLATQLSPLASRRQNLLIDGFNLIVTLEAALSGGILLHCRDGCLRDLASVHGSYRSVMETGPALALVGDALAWLEPQSVRWLLDQPVSNSGRLAQRIRHLAAERGWNWEVELVFNPDAEIAAATGVAVTSDSAVLDRVAGWVNLAAQIVRQSLPESWVVNLSDDSVPAKPDASCPS